MMTEAFPSLMSSTSSGIGVLSERRCDVAPGGDVLLVPLGSHLQTFATQSKMFASPKVKRVPSLSLRPSPTSVERALRCHRPLAPETYQAAVFHNSLGDSRVRVS